jgi:colanic acid biosynthesis glycosyl transferase WcaI
VLSSSCIARGIPADKIWVIRNGVDLQRYAPQKRDPTLALTFGVADRLVIGYVGTHGLAHDLGNVVAAADLLRQDKRLVFLLVGAGAERDSLIASAKQRGLDNVIFLSMQPKEMMPSIWALCDVALVHLKNSVAFAEVIPSKMFEAMAMGLPILLVAPQGEAAAILAEDRAGVWVPAGEPASLAEATKRLMNNNEECQALAAQSLASARHHTREEQATRFIAVLEGLRPGRPRDHRKSRSASDCTAG